MHDGKTASENILTIFARSFWLLPLLASADPVPPNIKHVVEPLLCMYCVYVYQFVYSVLLRREVELSPPRLGGRCYVTPCARWTGAPLPGRQARRAPADPGGDHSPPRAVTAPCEARYVLEYRGLIQSTPSSERVRTSSRSSSSYQHNMARSVFK